jgi:carboxymethylenebutenolidase
MASMGGLRGPAITADLQAASEHLVSEGLPQERQAVFGFCIGGTVAFRTAVDLPLDAASSCDGGGVRSPASANRQ